MCKLKQIEMSRAAENQLRTYAPVAVLSDKWEIFRLRIRQKSFKLFDEY